MNINATLVNLYRVCTRECWLHANGINMEQSSDLVSEGKIIEEESYNRRSDRYTQVELSAVISGVVLTGKIDFFDTRYKIVHETKRSNKVEDAHVWQVKFYLWLLGINDIEVKGGVIEYPRLRQKEDVIITKEDEEYLQKVVLEISHLIKSNSCPSVINSKICRSCSYHDFCYVDE